MNNQTYITKLESHFNPAFINMQVNQKLKKHYPISYVRMLEQMCKERNIEVQREAFPITNNFIYIKDQNGNEKCWTIEYETDHGTYKVYHYDFIAEVYVSKTYRDELNRLCYSESVYVPENSNETVLDYIEESLLKIIA